MYYFNKQLKYVVFVVFSLLSAWAQAGAYEDFFKAVQLNNVRVVQALLQRGFDPNSVSPEGVPALMVAVREPAIQVAELLASWPTTRTDAGIAQGLFVIGQTPGGQRCRCQQDRLDTFALRSHRRARARDRVLARPKRLH